MKTTKILIILAAIILAQIYSVSALTINSVSSNPGEIQPGEKFTLDLKIENNLKEDVEEVIVSLDLNAKTSSVTGQVISPALPFAPYESSNEARIDKIREGEDERASFDLTAFPDAISGTYTIPVTIQYTLDNETEPEAPESLGVVSVIINAKPKIDVSSEGSALIKGTNGKITIKIVNSGLGDAKFLSLGLNQVTGIQITGSNKVYIGNIDSNDFDSAEFSVFVKPTASSSINVPVELIYTDSGNNKITENKTIPIKIYTAKEAVELGLVAKNNTFVIVISVIGVLVLFFIYRRARKRARNKKNNS